MSYDLQSGSLNTVHAPPKVQPQLTQLDEQFEKSLSEMMQLNARLQQAADRLFGGIPESVDKDGQLSGTGAIGKLHLHAGTLGGQLRKLRNSIERIESL
jgi:hypothetical protein